MIHTRDDWPRDPGGVAAGSRRAPSGRQGGPPPFDPEDDEPGSKRVIRPEVFEELAGRRGLLSRLKKFSGYVALAAVGFILAVVLLKPGSNGGTTPQTYSPPTEPPAASTRASGVFSSNPIGRLMVDNELPDNAWLEIDGRVYTSGLGIDFPLRVVGDTTHKVAVHARGYTSWESEVYVPKDTLVRLSVTIALTEAAQAEMRATQRPERQPEQRQAEPPLTQPTRADTRPAFPNALRDSLILALEEGRVFHDIGRYFDAATQYRYVLDRVAGASVQYRSSSVMEMLRARADSAMQAARLDCRSENRESCP